MDVEAAFSRLPETHAAALRLRARGFDEDAIAAALALEPEAVGPLLRIGEAKLGALTSRSGEPKKQLDEEKGAEMHTRKRHLRTWIPVAFAVAAVAAPAAQATGPDDHAVYRGTSLALAPTSLSPDDRGFYRGASDTLAPTSQSPDDRPFAGYVRDIEPRTVPVVVVDPPRGFDWGDAAIGGAFGLALALLGAGAILIAHRRRSTLSPA